MSDQTLDSSTPIPIDPDQLPLSRNSSFSKLNAKAPEFVPMKPAQSPPLPSPLAVAVGDHRMMMVPTPPTSPALVPVYPPPPTMVVPVRGVPHPHAHHHQLQGGGGSGNSSNDRQYKKYSKQGDGVGSSQGGQDKDQGGSNGLSDEAAQKLINQVEYYFSDVNLATTDHLIKFIFKDPEGFVPVSVVASFKKIKALISSNSQLAAVLRNSTKLAVSDDGKKVKRLQPLTSSDMEELQARIIVAENLPEDHCHQNLMKIFSVIGSVKSIRTCQPQPSNNGASAASRSSKTDNYPYNKLHAFVEYETIELAEKAIAELNVEDSWRNGLRVRPLSKQVVRSPQRQTKKAGNDGEVNGEESISSSEQNQNEKITDNITQSPALSPAQSPDHYSQGEEQGVEREGGQKKSRNRGKGKGRGRGHNNNNNNNNNHNHHHQANNRTSNGEQPVIGAAKQPPPGPRMPDGTRGFSLGRGKPLTVPAA